MAQLVKSLPAMWETWVQSLGWVDSPGEGKVYLLQCSGLENPYGQRSLVDDRGHKELDMTEQLCPQHSP